MGRPSAVIVKLAPSATSRRMREKLRFASLAWIRVSMMRRYGVAVLTVSEAWAGNNGDTLRHYGWAMNRRYSQCAPGPVIEPTVQPTA